MTEPTEGGLGGVDVTDRTAARGVVEFRTMSESGARVNDFLDQHQEIFSGRGLFTIVAGDDGDTIGLSDRAVEVLDLQTVGVRDWQLEVAEMGEEKHRVLLVKGMRRGEDRGIVAGLITAYGAYIPYRERRGYGEVTAVLSAGGVVRGLDLSRGVTIDTRLYRRGEKTAVPEREPLAVENIPRYEYASLVRVLVHELEQGWVPSREQGKALVVALAQHQGNRFGDSNRLDLWWKMGLGEGDGLVIQDMWGFYLDEGNYIVAQGRSEFAYGLADVDDADAMYAVIHSALTKMEIGGRVEVGKFILDNYEELLAAMDTEGTDQLYDLVFKGVDNDNPLAVGLGVKLAEKLAQMDMTRFRRNSFWGDDEAQLVWNIMWRGDEGLVWKGLTEAEVSEGKKIEVAGMLLWSSGIAREMNVLRGLLEQELPVPMRGALEGFARRILGLWGAEVASEIPVHTALDQLYREAHFDMSGGVSAEALVNTLRDYGVKADEAVLDLACGTGWLTKVLVGAGYDNVVGLDHSEEHIARARGLYPDIESRFQVGDWYSLPDEERYKAVACVGRSLPHTEDERNLELVFRQVWVSMEDDGVFVFDMPDPTKGEYADKVQRYRRVLEGFGFDGWDLEDVWVVVDHPPGDERNYYNRYVPPEEEVRRLLGWVGFEVKAVRRDEIPTGRGDENITYVCIRGNDPMAWGNLPGMNEYWRNMRRRLQDSELRK